MWKGALLAATAALAMGIAQVQAGNEPLCSLAPGSYASAKQSHPDMAFGLAELEKRGIALWYTDRDSGYASTAQQIVNTCPSSSRMTIVVYGLPHKDCAAGESSSGAVQSNGQYQQFVSQLQQTVGNRKVLYIVEPDALGLLASNPCGKANGYEDNLGVAIKTLSQNPNADLYLDVGHWVLSNPTNLANVASAVKRLQGAGRLKGISINTSNYRSNSELTGLCSSFRSAVGGDYHCVLDTSRNYNGPSSQNEWCNYKNAGIGKAPTGNTGDPNIDYYIWVKPPGESDGQCSSSTSDAMKGTTAGSFFPEYFKQLWNSGALVKEMNMPAIDGSIHQVAADTSAPTTSAPTTSAPTTNAVAMPTVTKEKEPQSASPAPSSEAPANKSTALQNVTDTSAPSVASDADMEAGTVAPAAPVDKTEAAQPIATIAPATASTAGSGSETNQVQTKAQGTTAMSSGLIVMIALIAVAAVALVVVVAFRVRQSRLDDDKSPMELDPRIQTLSRFSEVSAL